MYPLRATHPRSPFELEDRTRKATISIVLTRRQHQLVRRSIHGVFAVRFALLVAACSIGLFSGCYSPRNYRASLNEMRAEQLAVEDRYYALEDDFRRQEIELERLRKQVGASDELLDFDLEDQTNDLEPDPNSASRSNGSSGRFASQSRRSNSRSNRSLSPQVKLPGKSLSPDEFMKLLDEEEGITTESEGPELNISLPFDEDEEESSVEKNRSTDTEIPLDEPAHFSPIQSSRAGELANDPLQESHAERSLQELDVLANHGTSSGDRTETTSLVSREIAHIVINPILTRGHDLDGKDGDDGLRVVIETRNAQDLFVAAAGKVLVSVIDPAESGDAQRVGMWEFSTNEVAARVQDKPGAGRGINLIVPWQNGAPKNRQLRVFVRLITDEGRQLETSGTVSIAITGDGATGWATRSTPRYVPDSIGSQLDTSRIAERDPFNDRSSLPPKSPNLPGSSGSNLGRPDWRPYR